MLEYEQIVFVQNEQIECIITLSNPFSFDLEFPDISLA
ncbi:MAG: hypothetical protein EOP04_15985 [Proteobacteria bacterium]|nr:MAG: hypothetical protein EOP04_15985 [Pseudomonadota bacterium]